MLHGAGSFQGGRACDVGKRGMDDPQVFGHKDWTRRAGELGWEWEKGNRVATRAGDNGLQARHLGQKKGLCRRIEGRHVVEQCIQTRATVRRQWLAELVSEAATYVILTLWFFFPLQGLLLQSLPWVYWLRV